MTRPATPVCIARSIDFAGLSDRSPCVRTICLGSFWPYSKHSRESHIVKGFKESCPVGEYQPHILRLCEVYARLILDQLTDMRFDWVARVLGSTEQRPDPERSLALLESLLCARLHARSLTHLLYRTQTRPAMRLVGQLSGPELLRRRLRYAAQDLFISPASAGGRALLIDDIYNTGATVRVYGHALREFAGVESVVSVNLAATRFKSGKDGHGWLQIPTADFDAISEASTVWLDSSSVFHLEEKCAAVEGTASAKLQFVARRLASPCPICATLAKPRRKIWSVFNREPG